MLNRLQQKWKVGGWQLALIIITFAVGGSITGYFGRRLMGLLLIDNPVLWTIIYIIVITLLWPIAVLLVSIPLGQFIFFKNYLSKIGKGMGIYRNDNNLLQMNSKNKIPTIAIFASGAGTNAEKIIESVATNATQVPSEQVRPAFRVGLIVCNKPGAGVFEIAEKFGIPVLLIEKEKFFRGNAYVDELRAAAIDFIVLAGFLWKIPQALIVAYPNRIINIHPALLPKYGGKGMYGAAVHSAVIANGDSESGITIHWVDEHYDHGSIIFQATCPVLQNDTPETLAARIHKLEHENYPAAIAQLVSAHDH
jgi:formyltetrahydrofolate-dependent phosphoribosylglycinamide formyltransferase